MARKTAKRLTKITRRVARDTGNRLLEVDKLSADHTPCDEYPWATGFPEDLSKQPAIPWHPDRLGHRAIAAKLAKMLSW